MSFADLGQRLDQIFAPRAEGEATGMRRGAGPWLAPAGAWLAALVGFRLLAATDGGTLPGTDSLFHAKLGRLIAAGGMPAGFTWVQDSTQAARFVDLEWLFHRLLSFFVGGGDLTARATWAVAFFGACLALGLFLFLRAQGVRAPGAWLAAALASSGAVLARLTLVDPTPLALALVLGGLTALVSGHMVALGVLSLLLTMAGGGWLFLLLFLVLVRQIALSISEGRLLWRPAAASAGGMLAGLLLSPAPRFPGNVVGLWHQLLEPILSPLPVPGPGGFVALPSRVLLGYAGLPALAVAAVLFAAVVAGRRLSRDAVWLFVATVGLGAGLMFANRCLEPFVLVAVAFVAVASRDVFSADWLAGLSRRGLGAAGLVALGTLLLLVRNVTDARAEVRSAAQGFPTGDYQAIAAWLTRDTPKDAVVVADLDDFPRLFYWNDHNRYAIGLDAASIFRKDPVQFQRYDLLYRGLVRDPENLLPALGSSIVVVRKWAAPEGHARLYQMLKANRAFGLAQENDALAVFVLLARGPAPGAPQAAGPAGGPPGGDPQAPAPAAPGGPAPRYGISNFQAGFVDQNGQPVAAPAAPGPAPLPPAKGRPAAPPPARAGAAAKSPPAPRPAPGGSR